MARQEAENRAWREHPKKLPDYWVLVGFSHHPLSIKP
jgi:hypothetical protein